MKYVVSLDVGGSSVKSAAVKLADRTNVAVTTTPIDSLGSKSTILDTLRRIIQNHRLEIMQRNALCVGVSVGFPGPFDYASGTALVKGVKKYEAIYGLNLRNELQAVINDSRLPIKFQNDAVCALIAEACCGKANPQERILGIVLGTGMGSAFIVESKQITMGKGIPQNGYLYSEPFAGTTADEIFSTRGLQQRLRNANGNESIPAAAQQARMGDDKLLAVFAEFGRDLGTFLTPFATDFQADALILLGGIAHTEDLFGEALKQHLSIPFFRGSLEDKAGVVGASLLFREV